MADEKETNVNTGGGASIEWDASETGRRRYVAQHSLIGQVEAGRPTNTAKDINQKRRRKILAKVLFYLFYSLGIGSLALIMLVATTSTGQGAGLAIYLLMILLSPVGAISIVIALLMWLWAFRLGAVRIDLWNIVLLVLGIILLFLAGSFVVWG